MSKLENLVAYKGDIVLEKAVWDNVSGMTVLFQLEQRPHELTAANPFKKFTKMRGGKVGTRFNAVITDSDGGHIYHDELMLKGWNDGTNGWKVTFWLEGTDGLVSVHPFMEYEKGQEFAMAVVELDDDNEAIDQVKREKVTKPRKQGLSNYAAMLCRTDNFHRWMEEAHGVKVFGLDNADLIAKSWMCRELNIESRAELDSSRAAEAAFHTNIRKPYADWNEGL